MFATTHVLTGAAIGRRIQRPAPAFVVGFVSHIAMDALPHWGLGDRSASGRHRFLRIAAVDGLLLSSLLAVLWRQGRTGGELAGAVGALLLDLDKPAELLGVTRLWPDPLHHAHVDIQIWEAPNRWWVDVGCAVAAVAVNPGWRDAAAR